jgi:hypothetical protein
MLPMAAMINIMMSCLSMLTSFLVWDFGQYPQRADFEIHEDNSRDRDLDPVRWFVGADVQASVSKHGQLGKSDRVENGGDMFELMRVHCYARGAPPFFRLTTETAHYPSGVSNGACGTSQSS